MKVSAAIKTALASGWAESQEILLRSLHRLLVPIARLLMRNGIGYPAFAEMAKRAFVEAAMAPDVHGPFRTTKARTALLTGLTRPEVRRILETGEELPTPLTPPAFPRSSRVGRRIRCSSTRRAVRSPYPRRGAAAASKR